MALKEAFRVLKQNGKLIFSVGISRSDTIKRAEIVNGELVLLADEIYHGNPISDKGSLVFTDFGWDILDLCVKAGFSDAYLAAFLDEHYAHLAFEPLYLFVAVK